MRITTGNYDQCEPAYPLVYRSSTQTVEGVAIDKFPLGLRGQMG